MTAARVSTRKRRSRATTASPRSLASINTWRARPGPESVTRIASPPIRALLTSSTRTSRTAESWSGASSAATRSSASMRPLKVAQSQALSQFSAHHALAPRAPPRRRCPVSRSPFPRFGYDPHAGWRPASGSRDQRPARRAGTPDLAVVRGTGRARPDWAEPWTLLERGGQKIAVIGLALRATPTNTAPRNVTGLAFGDGAAAVKRVLPQARAAASFVIVVAHEGAFCDAGGDAAARPLAATACHGEILDVARRLDSGSVDLIVSGHTHSLVNTVVNGIPVVQARSSGAGIAVVDFVRGPGGRREVLARVETPYTDRVSPDPELQNLMALFKVGIENLTSRAITRIKVDLRRQGDEYGLGRLIADAMRNVAKADVAIVNNGGIRADLASGTATYGDLYHVMPFQNRMLRLTVKGDVLRQALEHAVAGDRPDGHVSGVELWYDSKQRPGRRIGKAVLADGKGIDGGRSYTLAVSDFLATGGSGYTMLVGSPAADLDVVDLDAFIQYLAVLRQPIAPPDDARWHKKGGGG